MTYIPTKWENFPSVKTPIDADNLNKLEQGVKDAHDGVDSVNTALNGKFDKAGGTITGDVTFSKNAIKSTNGTHTLPAESGTLMQVGDYGIGKKDGDNHLPSVTDFPRMPNGFFSIHATFTQGLEEIGLPSIYGNAIVSKNAPYSGVTTIIMSQSGSNAISILRKNRIQDDYELVKVYTTVNTTKDANGNLKVASPIVKVFADHIETNEDSEGVEMEHLGVGHYLIKGVVGFNADGAWGINNGFVIPQDHNGKNMVLIDYEVKPDGDIEVFVFHQQNADLPERFQNKRIKHIDKDGNPVYYENYEPCDIPEGRWIDMRVEMPPNSIYNLKKAEAERLAKEAEADNGKKKK